MTLPRIGDSGKAQDESRWSRTAATSSGHSGSHALQTPFSRRGIGRLIVVGTSFVVVLRACCSPPTGRSRCRRALLCPPKLAGRFVPPFTIHGSPRASIGRRGMNLASVSTTAASHACLPPTWPKLGMPASTPSSPRTGVRAALPPPADYRCSLTPLLSRASTLLPTTSRESLPTPPSSAALRADFDSLHQRTAHPSWLRVAGRPVLFVYNIGPEATCSAVSRLIGGQRRALLSQSQSIPGLSRLSRPARFMASVRPGYGIRPAGRHSGVGLSRFLQVR